MLINREKSAHWYRVSVSGEVTPFFEVPKKSGDGMKAVTIREAREVGALASVTSILKVLAKPGLESWKQEQILKASQKLPQFEGESIEDWARRIVEESEKVSGEAADFGTLVHDSISAWISRRMDPCEAVYPYMTQFMAWFETNITSVTYVEKLVHHTALKYAGTMDFLGKLVGGDLVICDWKTQRVKRNAKGEKVPAFYEDSWPLQLSAYAACDELVEPTNASWPALISVIIDSSEPGPVYVKEWKPATVYWEMFQNCLKLWKFTKGYNV